MNKMEKLVEELKRHSHDRRMENGPSEKDILRSLCLSFIKLRIIEYGENHESFTISELLNDSPDELNVLRVYYKTNRVFMAEVGKLIAKCAKQLGLEGERIAHKGSPDGLTRYFYV